MSTASSEASTVIEQGIAIADVEIVRGERASGSTPSTLLVEVPHGADERAHYDALAEHLKSPLPEALHEFFHVNTDVGAWHYGRRAAERVLAAMPERAATIVRCRIPRTFIDTNREVAAPDALASGGLTGAVAPYVTDPRDLALLHALHAAYVRTIDAAYDDVARVGGMALTPHTYGPYVLPIAKIDETIVAQLRAAHAPEVLPTLKVRDAVDLLTEDDQGRALADPELTNDVERGLKEAGLEVVRNRAYRLLPGSQTHRQSVRHPGRVFCLEVRRDLVVERYTALTPMVVRPDAIETISAPLAEAIVSWLGRR